MAERYGPHIEDVLEARRPCERRGDQIEGAVVGVSLKEWEKSVTDRRASSFTPHSIRCREIIRMLSTGRVKYADVRDELFARHQSVGGTLSDLIQAEGRSGFEERGRPKAWEEIRDDEIPF